MKLSTRSLPGVCFVVLLLAGCGGKGPSNLTTGAKGASTRVVFQVAFPPRERAQSGIRTPSKIPPATERIVFRINNSLGDEITAEAARDESSLSRKVIIENVPAGRHVAAITGYDAAGEVTAMMEEVLIVAPGDEIFVPVTLGIVYNDGVVRPASLTLDAGETLALRIGNRYETKTYLEPGVHDFAFPASSSSATAVVTVQGEPDANALFADIFASTTDAVFTGAQGALSVRFVGEAVSASPVGNVSYSWNFGDGTTQTTTRGDLYHSYSASGNYVVSLIVSADGRQSAPVYARITVYRMTASGENLTQEEILSSSATILPKTMDSNRVILDEDVTFSMIINNEILARFKSGLDTSSILAEVAAIGGQVVGYIPALGQVIIRLNDGVDLDNAITALNETGHVEYAFHNEVGRLQTTPNDPQFNDASRRGYLDEIHAQEAWGVSAGSPSIKIAVIDTGVDVNHKDLAPNISGAVNVITGDDKMPLIQSHGTQMAGLIAARGNNSFGMAGVCWNCSLIPINVVYPETGYATTASLNAGVIAALEQGADMISISMGFIYNKLDDGAFLASMGGVTAALESGIPVFAPGGDDPSNPEWARTYIFPGNLNGVIRIGKKPFFSSLDYIWAPGESIFSTMPNNDFGFGNGTSMSTAIAAGVGGLMLSVNPDLTPTQIRNILILSADPVEGQPSKKMINAYNAVVMASNQGCGEGGTFNLTFNSDKTQLTGNMLDAAALTADLTLSNGAPLPGVEIIWTVTPPAAGTLSQLLSMTDADGMASVTFTVGLVDVDTQVTVSASISTTGLNFNGCSNAVNMTASVDPGRIACSDNADCSDGDNYTQDTCLNGGTVRAVCIHDPIACFSAQDCGDGDNYTQDTCLNGGTVEAVCTHDSIACFSAQDCGDGDDHTEDLCIEPGTTASACSHAISACIANSECDDFDPLTYDACDNPGTAAASCSHTPVVCAFDSDCDDHEPLTLDTCVSGGTINAQCSNATIECNYNSDCDDQDDYTEDICIAGGTLEARCNYGEIICNQDTDCADTNDLTLDSCLDPGTIESLCSNILIACNVDADCLDTEPGTVDLCHDGGSIQSVCENNWTPIANAGVDITLAVGSVVTLDGSGSLDQDSTSLTFAWTQTSGPEVTLTDSGAESPSFIAPQTPATLVFSLGVSDGVSWSQPDSAQVNIVVGSVSYIKIVTNPSAGYPELGDTSVSADSTLDVYCAGFDQFGNYVGDVSATWTVSGGIGAMQMGIGASDVFVPSVVGSGVISASAPGVTGDSTGTISVNMGAVASVTVLPEITPYGIQDTVQQFTLTGYDAKGNSADFTSSATWSGSAGLTPTGAPGQFTFTGLGVQGLTGTYNGQIDSVSFTVYEPDPAVQAPSFGGLTFGDLFDGTFTMVNGTQPAAFSISYGAYPPSWTFDTETGQMTGTVPLYVSGWYLNVRATDNIGRQTDQFTDAEFGFQLNVDDEISTFINKLAVAEGALSEISDLLQNMRQLAILAAGEPSEPQRTAYNDNYQASITAIDQIVASATYEGVPLLDGTYDLGGGKVSRGASGVRRSFVIVQGNEPLNIILPATEPVPLWISLPNCSSSALGLLGTDLLTQVNAEAAIPGVDAALGDISWLRGAVGAKESESDMLMSAYNDLVTRMPMLGCLENLQGFVHASDSMLGDLVNALQAMRNIAVQGANSGLSEADRASLDTQAYAYMDFIDLLSYTATYYEQLLFDGNLSQTCSGAPVVTNPGAAPLDLGLDAFDLTDETTSAASITLIDNVINTLSAHQSTLSDQDAVIQGLIDSGGGG